MFMKKISLVFVSLVLLTSCFSSSDNTLDEAKQELLHPSESTGGNDIWEIIETWSTTTWSIDLPLDTGKKVSIEYLDEKTFITLDELTNASINPEEIVFSWKTQPAWVDKIVVQFQNGSSAYPLDSYTLKTYTPGDLTFKYIASSRQRVLDYGKNEYLFTAYSGGETSQVKVEILLDKNEDARKDALSKTLTWSSEVGTVQVKDSQEEKTTTNIAGLSIARLPLDTIDCSQTDAITDFLLTKHSWAYWNTCRDIVKEKSIVFNVLRLEWEKYLYERHYYDFTSGTYGILTLESGTGTTKETMWDKNKELKSRDFSSTYKEADAYFKTLLTTP
jgi:hypothetical protein